MKNYILIIINLLNQDSHFVNIILKQRLGVQKFCLFESKYFSNELTLFRRGSHRQKKNQRFHTLQKVFRF